MSSDKGCGLVIRDYQRGDFDSLCRLDQMCYVPEIAYSPDEIASMLDDPRSFTLVAEWQEQVSGFILASLRRRVLGHVITIDVHPDFRRLRIGDRLMESAEQRLREQGAARIVLEVATNNSGAIAFYDGRGYLRQRLLPRYYRDGSDAYLMEKALCPLCPPFSV